MEVKCNNCGIRYEVSDALLGAGKKVKCTYCDLVWFQAPQESKYIPNKELSAFVESLEVEVAHDNEDKQIADKALKFAFVNKKQNGFFKRNFSFLLVLLINIIFVVSATFFVLFRIDSPFSNKIDRFMDGLGVWNSRVLELSDVDIKFIDNNNILLSFDIYNPSHNSVVVPYIQVKVKFKNSPQNMIFYLLAEEKEIVQGQVISFEKVFNNITDTPEEVIVRMMNFFGYKLRKILL